MIIIPCYNEAANVEKLFNAIKNVSISNCEITPLFINDCSKDNTLNVLESLGVKYLDNPINLNIGGTVQTGFIYANEYNYDVAVQMDGDGQHPPSELHKIVQPLLQDKGDIIIGSRFLDNEGFQSSALRRFGIDFFCKLNRLLVGVTVRDSTSGYRAYNKKAIAELIKYYPDEYPEPEAIVYLANKKLRIKEVAVLMSEREGGVSSIRRFTSIYYMVKVSLNTFFLHLKMRTNG